MSDVVFENGKTYTMLSDNSFRTIKGATVRSCLYTGETVDGRILETADGWRLPSFCYDEWSFAVATEAPAGKLEKTYGPPVRVIESFSPNSVEQIEPNCWMITFPKTISGWCRIRANGKPGSVLKIKYGEKLKEGHIDLEQCSAPWRTDKIENYVIGDLQTDEYIFGSNGVMDFEPKFSYKGFKYVELNGEIEDIKPDDIMAHWIASDTKNR